MSGLFLFIFKLILNLSGRVWGVYRSRMSSDGIISRRFLSRTASCVSLNWPGDTGGRESPCIAGIKHGLIPATRMLSSWHILGTPTEAVAMQTPVITGAAFYLSYSIAQADAFVSDFSTCIRLRYAVPADSHSARRAAI